MTITDDMTLSGERTPGDLAMSEAEVRLQNAARLLAHGRAGRMERRSAVEAAQALMDIAQDWLEGRVSA